YMMTSPPMEMSSSANLCLAETSESRTSVRSRTAICSPLFRLVSATATLSLACIRNTLFWTLISRAAVIVFTKDIENSEGRFPPRFPEFAPPLGHRAGLDIYKKSQPVSCFNSTKVCPTRRGQPKSFQVCLCLKRQYGQISCYF